MRWTVGPDRTYSPGRVTGVTAMSSFPEGTEDVRLVGEGGVQSADTRDATGMTVVDLQLRTHRTDKRRIRASKASRA